MRLVKLVPEKIPSNLKKLARKYKGFSVPFKKGSFITFMPYSGANDCIKKGYWGYPENAFEKIRMG